MSIRSSTPIDPPSPPSPPAAPSLRARRPSRPTARPSPETRTTRPTAALVRWSGRIAVLALLALGPAACGGGPPAPPPLAPIPEEARLYYDDSGGLADSLRMVVREAERWDDVWNRATSRREEPPPAPAIDFDDQMALVVAAGRMSPGDGIRVDSVGFQEVRTADGDTEEVLSAVVRTVRGCGRFSGDAYPVEIVRVRRWEGRVEFLERSETSADCRTGASAPAADRPNATDRPHDPAPSAATSRR